MKYKLVLKKLSLLNKKIITNDELKIYFDSLNINYRDGVNYLTNNRYLLNIFRGLFYILSIEERSEKSINTNIYDLIEKSLDIKKINKWYFGLDTSLKINNIKHEFDNVIYIINNKIYRNKIIKINGYNIKIIKIKDDLLNFGVFKKNNLRCSDLEKTVLDIIYLDRYKGLTNLNILNKINDLLLLSDKKKILLYSKKYPKTVNKFIIDYYDKK